MMFPRLLLSVVSLGLLTVFAGCASSLSKRKPEDMALVRFMLESSSDEAAGTVRLPRSETVIAIAPKSLFTEFDIAGCSVVDNEFGKSLAFQLTPQAGRDLFRVTASNQGLRLVTVVNGVAVGARRIERPWNDGYILTYVELPDDKLEKLAKDIAGTSKDAQKDMDKRP